MPWWASVRRVYSTYVWAIILTSCRSVVRSHPKSDGGGGGRTGARDSFLANAIKLTETGAVTGSSLSSSVKGAGSEEADDDDDETTGSRNTSGWYTCVVAFAFDGSISATSHVV